MDKKIILLIILSLFLFVAKAAINLVNVYPANEKIQVLGFINATTFYSPSSSQLLYTLCDLHYPVLACVYTNGNLATHSKKIYVINLRNNSSITIELNNTDAIIGALVYFNELLNIARIYYVDYVTPYYYIRYFDVFLNNHTITSPTVIYYGTGTQTSTIGFYYTKKYSFLYVAKSFYLFLNKTNGFFTYNISSSDILIPLGDYIIKIPCYRSTAGRYDITVYTAFFENPKNIYSHYTASSSCDFLAVITNFAPFTIFYHSFDALYEGFTLQFTKFLYDSNKKYNISAIGSVSGFMQVNYFYSYSNFYGLILNRTDVFIYDNKSYYISHVFETREICDGCGIMVLNDVNIRNNTIFLLVRKNPTIEGYYLDLLFSEDFYYNATEGNAVELFGALSSNLGNVILNIFNNNTYRTFSIPISTTNNGTITSGKFIYFEKANHENVSITVSFQNTLAPAHLYPLSSQNFLINPRSSNLVYFNLQNVQNCEDYIINILGVPVGLNSYIFFRNAKFDFSCRAMMFLRPFDRIYKIIVYDKNGNKVYETGGFYITQSEYFIRINQGYGGSGTINIEDINITYSCNTYNINETHAKHSCSVIANKQVNIRYLVKRINMFLNTSNIVCDYQTNGDIVAFECEIDKSKNYNVLLYANNNIIYSDFISFQSSNNIGFTNQENLIIVLFFVLVLGLITAFNPLLGLFTISVGLFILYFVGFLSINIIGLSSLVFLFAVLIYLFRNKLIYGE